MLEDEGFDMLTCPLPLRASPSPNALQSALFLATPPLPQQFLAEIPSPRGQQTQEAPAPAGEPLSGDTTLIKEMKEEALIAQQLASLNPTPPCLAAIKPRSEIKLSMPPAKKGRKRRFVVDEEEAVPVVSGETSQQSSPDNASHNSAVAGAEPGDRAPKDRKTRNREAAAQFRQRQRVYVRTLEKKVVDGEQHQKDMESQITSLTEETRDMLDQLAHYRHFLSCILPGASGPRLTSDPKD